MMARLFRVSILLGCLLAATGVFANTCTTCYIDYSAGNDNWDGTSKTFLSGSTGPWKHAPGMKGTGPAGTSSDGCTGNCATQSPRAGDQYILKGGVVWPNSVLPWTWSWNGSSTAGNPNIGCVGSGCIYIGIDPTWNLGTVHSVILARDFGGCGAGGVSVSINGGGGSGATAVATMLSPLSNFGDGTSYHVGYFTVTSAGSGYTSNPTVTVTGAGCNSVLAVADTQRAIIDGGAPGATWTSILPSALVTMTNQYDILDNIEVRNFKWDATVQSGNVGVVAGGGAHWTGSNIYIHNFYPAVHPTSGDGSFILSANGAGGEITNSWVNDAEPSFPCPGNTTYCSFGGGEMIDAGSVHNNHITHGVWMVKTANIGAGGTQYVYNNEIWGGMASDSGAHLNLFYLGGAGLTIYEYNNLAYDNAGSTSQIPEFGGGGTPTTYYVFNNVVWNDGSGNAIWAIDNNACTASGGNSCGPLHTTYYFWNNTCGGGNNPDQFAASCVNTGVGSTNSRPYLDINLYNNYAITSQAHGHWFYLAGAANTVNGVSSPSSNTADGANMVSSLQSSATAGAAITNIFQPTSSNSPTVTFAISVGGKNLTHTNPGCASPGLAALCYDINGNPRPEVGPWTAGAFVYTGKPNPPVQLATTPH
jgi:hypothetical protein